MNNYYYIKNGKRIGPVSFEEIVDKIKQRKIKKDNKIWHEELDDWQKAGSNPQFKSFFSTLPPLVPPVPKEDQNFDADKVKNFAKTYWYIPLIVILALLFKDLKFSDLTPGEEGFSTTIEIDDCQFDDDEKRELIDENLSFRFVRPGRNYDGDVEITIVNLSETKTFRLTQIGMRHDSFLGDDVNYHNPSVNILLNPMEDIKIEVNFPSFRKSYGQPYAILDSAEIICED